MAFDSNTLTPIKDLSFIIGTFVAVWKFIAFLQKIAKTATQIPLFMENTTLGIGQIRDLTEKGVTNHLTHMEDGITRLADATERNAETQEKFRVDLGKYIVDMSKAQAVILDRLTVEKSIETS